MFKLTTSGIVIIIIVYFLENTYSIGTVEGNI